MKLSKPSKSAFVVSSVLMVLGAWTNDTIVMVTAFLFLWLSCIHFE